MGDVWTAAIGTGSILLTGIGILGGWALWLINRYVNRMDSRMDSMTNRHERFEDRVGQECHQLTLRCDKAVDMAAGSSAAQHGEGFKTSSLKLGT